eukprot:gene5558-biopygen10257
MQRRRRCTGENMQIHHALSCSDMFCSVLFCSVLSCPVLSCSVLSCPVLSCPVLCCPVLFFLTKPSQTNTLYPSQPLPSFDPNCLPKSRFAQPCEEGHAADRTNIHFFVDTVWTQPGVIFMRGIHQSCQPRRVCNSHVSATLDLQHNVCHGPRRGTPANSKIAQKCTPAGGDVGKPRAQPKRSSGCPAETIQIRIRTPNAPKVYDNDAYQTLWHVLGSDCKGMLTAKCANKSRKSAPGQARPGQTAARQNEAGRYSIPLKIGRQVGQPRKPRDHPKDPGSRGCPGFAHGC